MNSLHLSSRRIPTHDHSQHTIRKAPQTSRLQSPRVGPTVNDRTDGPFSLPTSRTGASPSSPGVSSGVSSRRLLLLLPVQAPRLLEQFAESGPSIPGACIGEGVVRCPVSAFRIQQLLGIETGS